MGNAPAAYGPQAFLPVPAVRRSPRCTIFGRCGTGQHLPRQYGLLKGCGAGTRPRAMKRKAIITLLMPLAIYLPFRLALMLLGG